MLGPGWFLAHSSDEQILEWGHGAGSGVRPLPYDCNDCRVNRINQLGQVFGLGHLQSIWEYLGFSLDFSSLHLTWVMVQEFGSLLLQAMLGSFGEVDQWMGYLSLPFKTN